MSDDRLPQETIDYILDLLREEPETLKHCCLVSRLWVPRVRKHLFGRVSLRYPSDLEAWKKAFPEPTSSPGCFTRSLRIGYTEGAAAVSNGRSLIQTFSHVVQLQICAFNSFVSVSGVSEVVRSLPLLEDLEMNILGAYDSEADGSIFHPPTSPPLTGKLQLYLDYGIDSIARGLLDLPDGIRFREVGCAWRRLEDLQWITALVEGCAESLERVDIECGALVGTEAASIDLSKAIRLREVVLRLRDLENAWAGLTLKTLTPEHKDLQLISIYIGIREHGNETLSLSLWVDLDHTLVQLWESKAITIRVTYFMGEGSTEARKFVEQLLPEMTRRGIVELVALRYDVVRRLLGIL